MNVKRQLIKETVGGGVGSKGEKLTMIDVINFVKVDSTICQKEWMHEISNASFTLLEIGFNLSSLKNDNQNGAK